ncbi:hypothetical protein LCGC14_0282910 [marine sediment metagenome]|uniref:Uncharacterized protein n=1 Tax=marine sediment metagenome TaxID=412755 RepID=A0A0F9UCK9_9ZZZZ
MSVIEASNKSTNLKALCAKLHFQLKPSRVIALIDNHAFGISLVRVAATAPAGESSKDYFSHAWPQFRLALPGRILESRFDLRHGNGLAIKRVFASWLPADLFVGGLTVKRDSWVLVVRGRFASEAGSIVVNDSALADEQVHFHQLFRYVSDIAGSDPESDKLVV